MDAGLFLKDGQAFGKFRYGVELIEDLLLSKVLRIDDTNRPLAYSTTSASSIYFSSTWPSLQPSRFKDLFSRPLLPKDFIPSKLNWDAGCFPEAWFPKDTAPKCLKLDTICS